MCYYWINNGDRKNRSYNYKVSIFRSKIIERIVYKAPLYSINITYVSPKGTMHSEEYDEIMRRWIRETYSFSLLNSVKVPKITLIQNNLS